MDLSDQSMLRENLSKILDFLQQMEKQDEICQKIGKKIAFLKGDMAKNKATFSQVLAIILLSCALPILVILLLVLEVLVQVNAEMAEASPYFITALVAVVLIGFIVMLFAIHKNKNKKRKAKLAVEVQKCEEDLKKQVDVLNQIIRVNYSNFIALPEKYRYSFAVSTMLGYLNSMRADNMKEAINLYEEELHRMRMEKGQQRMIMIQQQQQRTLNTIQNYNMVSAVANVSTAISLW